MQIRVFIFGKTIKFIFVITFNIKFIFDKTRPFSVSKENDNVLFFIISIFVKDH